MLAILWRLNRFYVVNLMPERHSDNTQYFFENIMQELLRVVFSDGRKSQSHELNVYLNNYRVHHSKV
jgi:hypothetical protein